ncbi:MAG: hypothetical protein ACREJD_09445 [Phycisphaerales bacterium]
MDDAVSAASTQLDAVKKDQDAQKAAAADAASAVAKLPDGPEKVKAEASLQAALDKVKAIDAQVVTIQAAIDAGNATSGNLADRVKAADTFLADLNKPSAAVGTVSSIASVFNPAIGALITVIGGLGYNQLRLAKANSALDDKASNLADGAANIVRSFEMLAGISKPVAEAIAQNKDLLRMAQNGTGATIVDAVRGNPKIAVADVVAAA